MLIRSKFVVLQNAVVYKSHEKAVQAAETFRSNRLEINAKKG
jgi:hypothetical protein